MTIRTRVTVGWVLLGLVTLAGCTSPVAAGLDEDDANRVVVALDRASIPAEKEADPSAEGKFRVTVPESEAAHALATMRDEALPRPKSPGVLDAVGKGALVPSEAAERAEVARGIAGDLERTLESIDGVLAARVHLSIPEAEGPFARDVARPRPSASVLLEHQGSAPPIAVDAVQRLVAGGVAGMLPADVAVVMLSRPAPPAPGGDPLAHVGPIAVSRGSARPLQAALVALVALIAVLAAITIFLYTRLTRLRGDIVRARTAPAGTPSSPPKGRA